MSWLRTSFCAAGHRRRTSIATLPSADGDGLGRLAHARRSRGAASISSSMRGLRRRLVGLGDDDVERRASDPVGHFSLSRLTAWTPSMRVRERGEVGLARCAGGGPATPATSSSAADATSDDDRPAHDRPDDARPDAAALVAGRGRGTGSGAGSRRRRGSPGSPAGTSATRSTAMSTTEIVPTAIDRNSGSSSRNSPPIEIITARPEKNTARPAVLLRRRRSRRASSRPWRRSVRKRVIMNSE